MTTFASVTNDNSPKPLPYKEDGIIYSNSDTFDNSIRPISKMRLTRMDINYESIDKAAYEIVDSSIDWIGY